MGQAAGEACRITPPGSLRALSARPAAALRTRICALGHLRMSHVTHYNGQLEMGATCCPAAGTVTSAGQQRRQTPAWVSVGSRVASDMPEPARPCVPCVSEDGGHQLPPGDQATSRLHHKAPAPALAELGELSLSMGVERAGQPPGHVVATASLYAPVPWALGALRGKAGGLTTAGGRRPPRGPSAAEPTAAGALPSHLPLRLPTQVRNPTGVI